MANSSSYSPLMQRVAYTCILLLMSCSILVAQPKKKKDKKKDKAKTQVVQIDAATQRQIELDYVDACMEMVNGNPRTAIEHFLRILKLDPEHHASMYNLEMLYIEIATGAGDYEDAIQLGETTIILDPSNYWYYHTLVEVYRKKGDLNNAVRIQEIIVKLFPKENGVLSTMADLYTRGKNYDKALEIIKQMEARQTVLSEEVGMQKYRLFVEAGKWEEALTTINKIILLHPERHEYVYNKYSLLVRMNKVNEGVELLKNLLQKSPSDSYCLLTLADYYKMQNSLVESDKYLFLAFANPEISVDGKINVIQSMQKASDKDRQVEKRLAELIRIFTATHPNNAASYLLMGDYFVLKEAADSAHIMYKKAIEKDNTKIEVWDKLLESAFRMHNNVVLMTDVGEALELFPNNDKFTYYWGMANLGRKDYEQALYSFEKIRKRNRAEPLLTARVHAGIGTVMSLQGGAVTAEEEFKKAMNFANEDPLILSAYSVFLSNFAKNYPKAKELAEKSVQIAPKVPESQYALALALCQLNDTSIAYQAIQKAIQLSPNADYYELYGDILYKMGKKEDALKQWQQSITLGNTTLNITEKTRQ
jgi:pentatricopeptide repeat protein